MRAFAVVVFDVFHDSMPEIPWAFILGDVNVFCLQTPEPAFNTHIVYPSCLAVHALPDAVGAEKLDIIIARELASLIRIDDRRGAVNIYVAPS